MCFNGAKTWQLGWFTNYHVDLPKANDFNWNGDLIGFAERDSSSSAADRMIIRIRSSVDDYYIHFNRQIGMNAETKEGGNKVLVAKRSSGTGYAFSYLLAILGPGGVYTISNFNGSRSAMTIVVRTINTRSIPARANISVRFGPSSAPTRTPTRAPTKAPTRAPTNAPTRAPTKVRTRKPTRMPTYAPTRAPTRAPTDSPTVEPTNAPTNAPTDATLTPAPM